VRHSDLRPWQIQKDRIDASFRHAASVLLVGLQKEAIVEHITVSHSHVLAKAELLEVCSGLAHARLIELKSEEVARGHDRLRNARREGA